LGAVFVVMSPSAIAGVRVTSFFAGYDQGRDETQIVGLEHTTVVRSAADPNGNKKVLVGPGQSTTIKRGSMPSRPIHLPAASVRSLTGQTTAKGGQGKRAGAPNTTAEPRVPHRPGERAGSPEGRVVDVPVGEIKKGPLAPPPPPVH
jgi:hypothetical protein